MTVELKVEGHPLLEKRSSNDSSTPAQTPTIFSELPHTQFKPTSDMIGFENLPDDAIEFKCRQSKYIDTEERNLRRVVFRHPLELNGALRQRKLRCQRS